MSDRLTIDALLAAYRTGVRTPSQVAAEVLAAVSADDTPMWITRVPEADVLAAAAALDGADPALPLYGVPFAVKDNIDVAGLPTTAACPGFAYTPTVSAAVVDRLLAAGALLIGKTNLDQFATGLVGTRSPYGVAGSVADPARVSGGSSSGSALAVARGLVAFALGTDTAGSGRVPAAFNGLVGLKPTRGVISTAGVVPACGSLDCVSVFAQSTGDARAVLDVAAAPNAEDPWSRIAPTPTRAPLRRLGVPLPAQLTFDEDPAAVAWQSALDHAHAQGWDIVPVDVAPFLQAAPLLYREWVAERSHHLAEIVAAEPAGLDSTVASLILGGRERRAVDTFAAIHEVAALRLAAAGLWDHVDAVLMPTTPGHPTLAEVAAEPIAVNESLGRYTNFVNLLDLAALAVPSADRPDGLPGSVTLIGPAGNDAQLLGLGAQWCGEPADVDDPALVALAVVGAHMQGLPLNWQLADLGGQLREQTTTAATYRLHALAGGPVARPALEFVDEGEGDGGGTGAAIACEVWELPRAGLGTLLGQIPRPLGLGRVVLADGREVAGFICESGGLAGAQDVTHFGGWRAYLASRG